MANIYLRVSKYVAAFMRAEGDGSSRPAQQPISFSPYSQEYVVLVNGLRVVPEDKQYRAGCYSQSAWNNMRRGILPQGGMAVLKRDPSEFLTYSEVCALEKKNNKTHRDSYEFVCIAIPREVYNNGTLCRVTNSFTLDSSAANQLRRLLRDAFVRTFLDFETRSRTFANVKGFTRSNVEIIERFFMEYNVPVSHDLTERESLRKLIKRWREEAQSIISRPAIIADMNVTRIDEYEMRGGLSSRRNIN